MIKDIKKSEWRGAIFVLLGAALWGAFPILTRAGAKVMPPLTFAAMSILILAVVFFVYALFSNSLGELRQPQARWPLFMITLCVVVVPYSLFFLGAGRTSSVNASLLLLSEIIFTVAITPLMGEKTTVLKFIGAAVVLFGAGIILYHPGVPLFSNGGDLLIIFSTITYPFANFYGKKILNFVSPASILFARCLLGGIFLAILARLFEPDADWLAIFSVHWPLIVGYSLLILGVSKILWYKGLKYLDISKAVMLGMTFPAFSLIILLTQGEQITAQEWLGFVVLMVGTLLVVIRPSVDPKVTKYAVGL